MTQKTGTNVFQKGNQSPEALPLMNGGLKIYIGQLNQGEWKELSAVALHYK